MADDLFQALGGTAGCRKISEAFYARVERDPILRPLFPGKNLHCAIEEFAAFLVQFLGGPAEDAQRRWWVSLRESHLRFRIGQKERDAWMKNMVQTLDEVQIGEPVRSALRQFFERSSAYVVKRGKAPAAHVGHQDLARRWEAQTLLDEAVAAIRKGDADRAIALAESLASRVPLAGLRRLMLASGHADLRDYVRRALGRDPSLVRERSGGRTLLQEASGAGDLTTVELLLRLGADPNSGAHPPLYCAGNECKSPGGADVVRALVQAGADVNRSNGVKHCTALHMAARQDNVEVARALLECGAELEARDSLGDTPLRRAVNCDKSEVAALLIAAGADIASRGSKGLTPIEAARSSKMKRLFESGTL